MDTASLRSLAVVLAVALSIAMVLYPPKQITMLGQPVAVEYVPIWSDPSAVRQANAVGALIDPKLRDQTRAMLNIESGIDWGRLAAQLGAVWFVALAVVFFAGGSGSGTARSRAARRRR